MQNHFTRACLGVGTKETDSGKAQQTSVCTGSGESTRAGITTYLLWEAPARYSVSAGDVKRSGIRAPPPASVVWCVLGARAAD